MLLQRLRLHNFRSYQDQIMEFPEGSTVLSGDIGSGKSTILLAIEFALFGLSRPDLPGEMLLRKGSQTAQVELTFQLRGQNITIVRNLKKEKDAIKQTAGHIIINNQKKDLTTVELKAEIIALLGYPEEFITKNKNYIFRYTVYTPQEEMKSILQEDPEIRLDTLRKIFNIDRYKNIRENITLYLRHMRTELAVLNAKLEPQEELQRQHQNVLSEKKAVLLSLEQLRPKVQDLQQKIQQQQQEAEALEKEQQQVRELRQQHLTSLAWREEHTRQLAQIQNKLRIIEEQLRQLPLPEGWTTESIEREKQKLEQTKSNWVSQTALLQEKISSLQRRMDETTDDLSRSQQSLEQLPEKELQLQELNANRMDLDSLDQKKEQLNELLTKTIQMITKNETVLTHSQHLRESIATLENCPVCLQEVHASHKQFIQTQEDEKIQHAQNLLLEFGAKKIEIQEQREKVQAAIKKAIEQSNLRARLELELQQLRSRKERREQQELQRRQWQQELTDVQEKFITLKKESNLESVQHNLRRLEQVQYTLLQRKHLEQRQQELQQQLKERQEQLTNINSQILQQEEGLFQHPDRSMEINVKKSLVQETRQLEKSFSVQQAQLQTQLEGLRRNEENLQQQINALHQLQQRGQQRQQLYHWLEEYFLKLTYTIEKQVMLTIYHLFNQLFQEWFSILIDDPSIYSRIDDSFYPVIEQNGYEVPFLHLSGGEKTSAALAYRLALNRVINDVIHEISTKDLLILDEPTDGFSSEQLEKVREVLERLNLRQTIIVSHESKIESFVENVIRIHKEGHVSMVMSSGS